MEIPLVDLKAQHDQVWDEVEPAWNEVLGRTAFILGPAVEDFERAFAEFSGVAHCIGVGNGTDALELALRASGIGPTDEVIVPANTFIATALAVVRSGARPVLVDIDPATQLLDVDLVAEAVTPRTKAIMPVHLFGQMVAMKPLLELARAHDVIVVEDAAQAQGAKQNGIGAGALGSIAGTSFYPGKNLGAYGDAGGVLTDDDDLARRVRALRNYGSEVKYHHPEIGFNSRLDTLQAVVLAAKLRRLASWNEQRRAAACNYDVLLADVDGVVRPTTAAGNEHVWHLYVVRVRERDRVLAALHEAGIGAGVHYPVPIHLQGSFRDLKKAEGSYPHTERAAREILSLPMFAEITAEQQELVSESLRKALG